MPKPPSPMTPRISNSASRVPTGKALSLRRPGEVPKSCAASSGGSVARSRLLMVDAQDSAGHCADVESHANVALPVCLTRGGGVCAAWGRSVGLGVQAAFALQRGAQAVPVQAALLRHVAQRQHDALFHRLQAAHVDAGVGILQQLRRGRRRARASGPARSAWARRACARTRG